jgi:rRNA maturation endonuclease Nob1
MIVRCGACRSQFDVPGPGRYACPVCGSVNAVRGAGGPGPSGPPPGGPPPGAAPPPSAPPPPPAPEPPSPRLTCPECSFTFIVGDIDVATCPNCGAEVETGRGVADDGTD